MKIREWLKEYWFIISHSPNSPEGLRHRAERVEKEYGKDNFYAQTLRKMAKMKEEKNNE